MIFTTQDRAYLVQGIERNLGVRLAEAAQHSIDEIDSLQQRLSDMEARYHNDIQCRDTLLETAKATIARQVAELARVRELHDRDNQTSGRMIWTLGQERDALRDGLEKLREECSDKRHWLKHKLETSAVHVTGEQGLYGGKGLGGWCAIQIPDWDVKQKIQSLGDALAAAQAILSGMPILNK